MALEGLSEQLTKELENIINKLTNDASLEMGTSIKKLGIRLAGQAQGYLQRLTAAELKYRTLYLANDQLQIVKNQQDQIIKQSGWHSISNKMQVDYPTCTFAHNPKDSTLQVRLNNHTYHMRSDGQIHVLNGVKMSTALEEIAEVVAALQERYDNEKDDENTAQFNKRWRGADKIRVEQLKKALQELASIQSEAMTFLEEINTTIEGTATEVNLVLTDDTHQTVQVIHTNLSDLYNVVSQKGTFSYLYSDKAIGYSFTERNTNLIRDELMKRGATVQSYGNAGINDIAQSVQGILDTPGKGRAALVEKFIRLINQDKVDAFGANTTYNVSNKSFIYVDDAMAINDDQITYIEVKAGNDFRLSISALKNALTNAIHNLPQLDGQVVEAIRSEVQKGNVRQAAHFMMTGVVQKIDKELVQATKG